MTLRERVQNLSSRSEFFLVLALAFSYFVLTSLVLLLKRQHSFDLTTGRAIRGLVTETLILVGIAWILSVRDWDLRRLVGRFSWRSFFAGVPLAIGYYILYVVLVLAAVSVFGDAARQSGVTFKPLAPPALILVFLLLNSVFEESLVTGYIVSSLRSQGALLAVTASVFVRFLYHLYHGPTAALGILPLGVVFAAVYWRWRTLWPLFVAHSLLNLAAFASSS